MIERTEPVSLIGSLLADAWTGSETRERTEPAFPFRGSFMASLASARSTDFENQPLGVVDYRREGRSAIDFGRDGKCALIGGGVAAAGTGIGLVAASSTLSYPAANLGGYAVAQSLIGGGVATSTSIAAIGGPLIAGALATAGVGLAVGGYIYLVSKLFK